MKRDPLGKAVEPPTPEFEAWWLAFYGRPEDYLATEDEQTEYATRKDFAWFGWNARGGQHG